MDFVPTKHRDRHTMRKYVLGFAIPLCVASRSCIINNKGNKNIRVNSVISSREGRSVKLAWHKVPHNHQNMLLNIPWRSSIHRSHNSRAACDSWCSEWMLSCTNSGNNSLIASQNLRTPLHHQKTRQMISYPADTGGCRQCRQNLYKIEIPLEICW